MLVGLSVAKEIGRAGRVFEAGFKRAGIGAKE